jgi:hypothetical protein
MAFDSLLNFEPDPPDHMATQKEADQEYARNVGHERRGQAWILADTDVWYRNPYYSGPPVPHPEEEPEGAYA